MTPIIKRTGSQKKTVDLVRESCPDQVQEYAQCVLSSQNSKDGIKRCKFDPIKHCYSLQRRELDHKEQSRQVYFSGNNEGETLQKLLLPIGRSHTSIVRRSEQ